MAKEIDHKENFRTALNGDGDLSLLGLDDSAGLAFMLVADVFILGWIIMLVSGALWHTFDILAPISFWTSALVAAAVIAVAFGGFFVSRRLSTAD